MPNAPPTCVRVVLEPAHKLVVPEMLVGAVDEVWKLMITSSMDAPQGALVIVQRNVYDVPAAPVNVDEGLVGLVTVPPAPLMMLQEPLPTPGALAANVVDVPHTFWSVPALAAVGLATRLITMSSKLDAQGALLMVQRKV